MNKFNLEQRLVKFSVSILKMSRMIVNTRDGNHLAGQIIRSGTSVSLNYGEALGAESRKDFIHKMKISLKELRETYICMKIIVLGDLLRSEFNVDVLKKENDELISIFVKSILTAENNMKKKL